MKAMPTQSSVCTGAAWFTEPPEMQVRAGHALEGRAEQNRARQGITRQGWAGQAGEVRA